MTNDPRFPPDPAPRLIDILTFEEGQLLDVAGPLQVFASCNSLLRRSGWPNAYQMRVLAKDGGVVTSSSGLPLVATALPVPDMAPDTLVVAGGRGVDRAAEDGELVAWLRRHAVGARRIASVCTGAFLLAATGLLNGRRVATHWEYCDRLAATHPALTVERDPIFVVDERYWTSAGVTAGIDLALAMVEADLGRGMALAVARQLVVFLKRPGGQAQFSAALDLQRHDRFTDLHSWMRGQLAADLTLPSLARQAGMSERSLLRNYRAATGTTPARTVERLRVEAARQQLSDGGGSVKKVARSCGFGSEETMRRSFLRLLEVTPQAYRDRFGSSAAKA